MAIIYLLSAFGFGAALTRRIPFSLYRFEQISMAVVLGLFGWTWIAFLAVLVAPYDVALPFVIVLLLAASMLLWRGASPTVRQLEGGRRAWVAWGIGTAILLAVLVPLYWTHSLLKDADGMFSASSAWADYGLHASIITHISEASSLPDDLSIASGEKMTYPFLVDFLSGLLVQGGMTLQGSLFWPGILLSVALCQLMISVGLRLFGRVSIGLGGLGFALMTGSATGLWGFYDSWRESGQGLWAYLSDLPLNFSVDAERHTSLTNLLVDGIVPQRAIMSGLGVGLIVLTFLMVARERGKTGLLWPAALLVGLLPMAHAHSFIVSVALFAALILEAAWRKRGIPWAHGMPLVGALVIAIPQLAWQQLANGNGTGGRFRFAWTLPAGESAIPFWAANFGFIGLALLAIPFVMRRHRQVLWFLPMLLILFVTQIYAFQPFEYDNLKLIWWVYIIGGFFISYMVAELVRRNRAWMLVIVPIGVLSLAPAALAITRDLQRRDQFASNDDIGLADWIKRNTPEDAVFAATDRTTQPAATLAGRTLVLGYRGWLYNFSIPYTEREAAVRSALAGNFEDPALSRFGTGYLLVASSEDPEWTVDEAALANRTVLWSNATWRVYDVKATAASPAVAPPSAPITPQADTPDGTTPTTPDGTTPTTPDGTTPTTPEGTTPTTP